MRTSVFRFGKGVIGHEHTIGKKRLECCLGLNGVQQEPVGSEVVAHAAAWDGVAGRGGANRNHKYIIAGGTDN